MRKTARIFLVLASCATAHASAAAPILVSDGRQLAISEPAGLGCAIADVTFAPPAPFAPFDESHTLSDPLIGSLTASQSTTVEADQMGGSGAVSNTTGTSHFCATSTFSITFEVSSSSAYGFGGTLVAAGAEAYGIFRLSGSAGDEFDHLVFDGQSQAFEESGVLAPGAYTLLAVIASGASSATSSWAFDFELVPEPTSAALLALLALGARSRRARASRRADA